MVKFIVLLIVLGCMGAIASPLHWLVSETPECVTDYEHHVVLGLGRCYKLHKEEASFQTANNTCHSEGALLAVIDSLEEGQVLASIGHRVDYAPRLGVYRNIDGNWITVTGDNVVKAAGYALWDENEPYSGDYWRTGTFFNGKLRTASMDLKLPFICEMAL